MPGLWNTGMPAPIPNREYGEPGFAKSKKDSAGTKQPCKFCGTPTYRTVGPEPVCSFCTSKATDPWRKRL